MSLEKWVEYGWLRKEPTSPGEIKDLLGIVERSLADSKVEAVSTDLRFIAAFNAALCVATTALRASGHRTATQAGHHVKTIESLELTIKASPKLIQRPPSPDAKLESSLQTANPYVPVPRSSPAPIAEPAQHRTTSVLLG